MGAAGVVCVKVQKMTTFGLGVIYCQDCGSALGGRKWADDGVQQGPWEGRDVPVLSYLGVREGAEGVKLGVLCCVWRGRDVPVM